MRGPNGKYESCDRDDEYGEDDEELLVHACS